MAKDRRLIESFIPESYSLDVHGDTGHLQIIGRKVGRPSQRLTFHQSGLKILNAKIIRQDKRGDQEFTVQRINHHRSFEEVRLHASEMLFPGQYTVDIEYQVGQLKPGSKLPDRSQMPMIDDPEASASYNLKNAKI